MYTVDDRLRLKNPPSSVQKRCNLIDKKIINNPIYPNQCAITILVTTLKVTHIVLQIVILKIEL